MCVRRYLGFVLLVWFQGALHVQTSDQLCSAPRLNGGYWVPKQVSYNHEEKLTYACDNGRKPAVEGWWATSTCQNGIWSPKPQCIDEKACVPPAIPNAIYTVNTNGWYEENDIIRITCDKGYEYKQRDATAQCIHGNWSSVPVCEKSIHACGEPPQIPHAVIIDQGYQDFFAADTGLQYECEDGYTVDGADTKQSVYCITGKWTDGPVCTRSATQLCSAPRLNGGYWVPKQVTYNHEEKLTYACDNGRKPAVEGWWAMSTCQNGIWSPKPQCIDEKACIVPDILNGQHTDNQDGWYEVGETIRITCNKGYDPKGRNVTAKCFDGEWSSVLVCEKSINACGEPPQIPHAVIIDQGYQDFFAVDTKLQYECEDGYTVDGADTKQSVYCITGKWTDGPVCNKDTGRGAGLGGSADVGTGGRQTTSAGSGTQPEGGVNRPGSGHG